MLSKDPTGNFTKKTICATVLILAIIFLSITTADLSSNRNIVQADSVTGIGTGIFWDQNCTNSTIALEWGRIAAGSNNTLTIYVRNECSSDVTLLLRTSDHNPTSASSYMTLTWNYDGQTLKANQVIPIELKLTISPIIEGIKDFSFTTTITSRGE